MKDSQLSKDFDGLYHVKDIHLSALSPRVIHSITFSFVLSIYFAKKTNEMEDIKTYLFVYILTGALLGQFQGHNILMTSYNKHNTYNMS